MKVKVILVVKYHEIALDLFLHTRTYIHTYIHTYSLYYNENLQHIHPLYIPHAAFLGHPDNNVTICIPYEVRKKKGLIARDLQYLPSMDLT
jgi:hypothetical protein